MPLGSMETHAGKALCVGWLEDGKGEGDNGEDGGVSWKVISGGSDCCLKVSQLV